MRVEEQPKFATWAIVEDSGEYIVEGGFPTEKAARHRMLDAHGFDHDCVDFDINGNGHVVCLDCARQAREEEDRDDEADTNAVLRLQALKELEADHKLGEMKDGDRPGRIR